MNENWLQFGFCTTGKAGEVHLSDAGYDVVRAILIKFMAQAVKGEEAAIAMGGPGGTDYTANQKGYWKAVRTFLMGKIANQLTPRMNLKVELTEALQWRLGTHIPDRWAAAVLDASQEVDTDGTGGPADGGGGSGGDGADRGHPVDGGQTGQADPPSGPPGGSRVDPEVDGEKTRPTAKPKRGRPTAKGD